jgi:hypothetical protein
MNETPDNAAATDGVFAPAFIEIPTRLHLRECPDCGITFGLPLDLYLKRLAVKAAIYCPAGHLIELADDDAKPQNFLEEMAHMLAQLRQATVDADQLRNTLARVPRLAAAPPSEEEMQRRIKYLVNRAHHTIYGKNVCRFCEKVGANDASLRQHLKRDHLEEIAQLPPIFFDYKR